MAVSRAIRPAPPRPVFHDLLHAAQAHRNRVDGLVLGAAGLAANDWLCIVGVDSTTRVHLAWQMRAGQPDFNFQSADRATSGVPSIRRPAA
jgi:hypothetical protein